MWNYARLLMIHGDVPGSNRFGTYELNLTKPLALLPFGLPPPRESSRHAATAPV